MTGDSAERSPRARRSTLIMGLVAAFIFVLGAGVWIGSGGRNPFAEPTPPVVYVVLPGASGSTPAPTQPGGGESPNPSASLSADPGSTSPPAAAPATTPAPAPTPTPAGTPVHWYTASPTPTPVLPNLVVGPLHVGIHHTCGVQFMVNAMVSNNGPVTMPHTTVVHVIDVYGGVEGGPDHHMPTHYDVPVMESGRGIGLFVPITVTYGCSGTHLIYMQVDPDHGITEGNEGDNQQHTSYVMGS